MQLKLIADGRLFIYEFKVSQSVVENALSSSIIMQKLHSQMN